PLSPLLLFSTLPRPPLSPLFPYTTLFRSLYSATRAASHFAQPRRRASTARSRRRQARAKSLHRRQPRSRQCLSCASPDLPFRSEDRKSTRLNSSHGSISYAVFCLKKKKTH